MVFEPEYDSAFLSFRETLFETVDHPAESVVIGVSLQPRFYATGLHQVIEILDRSPATRVDAHRRYSHTISQLDAMQCVVDVFFSF